MSEDTTTQGVQPSGDGQTPPASSPDNKPTDQTPSSGGEQKPDASKDVPFHDHPRWKEREQEWNKRIEDLNAAWEDKFKTAFTANRPSTPQPEDEVKIPEWFGGDERQWKAYLADQKRVVEEAENRAYQRFTSTREAQDKAVADANKWFEDSIKEIESDTTVNPTGEKVDRNALLKFVLDEQLIDPQGRWNYKLGYKYMKALDASKPKGSTPDGLNDRKKLADATTKGDSGKSEGDAKNITTSEHFQNPANRPW